MRALGVILGVLLLAGCSGPRESVRQETTVAVRDTVLKIVPQVVKDTVSLSYVSVREDSALLAGQTKQTRILVDLSRRVATLEVQPPETTIVYRDTTIYQTKTETRIESVPFIEKIGWGAIGALVLVLGAIGLKLWRVF